MAHIRKLGKRRDGTTIFQARLADPNQPPGGTRKIERSFTSRTEAEDWIATMRSDQINGSWRDPRLADQPFQIIIDAWKESWQGGKRIAPNTERRYSSILRKYVEPEFGNHPIASVTHERVQRFVNAKASDPSIAAGTVRNVHAVMRTACAYGVRLNRMPTNPCLSIDLPRPNRQEMLFLAPNEVQAVANRMGEFHPAYRTLIFTAAYTGLRAGELAGLQRGDVDLLRGVVHVRRALKDVNGHLEVGPTKTHATRTVSLPTFLKEMLRVHLTTQPSEGDSIPGGTGPEAYVFTSKSGGPLRMGLVYSRYFKRAVAGWTDKRGKEHPGALPVRLHGLRFHDLRHTCAALSIAAGAHPKLISARLGHSSIQITLDRYGHLFPSMEEALAEALDLAFATHGSSSRSSEFALLQSAVKSSASAS
jgi:integrase